MANPIFEKQVLQRLNELTECYVNLAEFCQQLASGMQEIVTLMQEQDGELPPETSLETELGEEITEEGGLS